MVDLEDLLIAGLIYSINNEKDTTQLIKWLYEGGRVTPELGALIADILSGKVKAKPQKTKATSPKRRCALRAEIEYHQENLTEFKKKSEENPREKPIINIGCGFTLSWQDMEKELTAAGYHGVPDTKGEITRAAQHLSARNRGLTAVQIDEILFKRARKK